MTLLGSILFLCCISLHRFVGICYPVHSLHWVSGRRARLVSGGVWAIVLLCQAPLLYFSRTRSVVRYFKHCIFVHYFWDIVQNPTWFILITFNLLWFSNKYGHNICYDTTSPELFDDFLVYSSVVSVLMFALPFMVVMVCYGLMMRKLLEPTWEAEGREGERGCLAGRRSKQKSVKMIIIVLATFMLCFLPFHLTRSLYYSFRYLRQVDPAQVKTNPIFFLLCISNSNSFTFYVFHQISCSLLEGSSIAYKVTRPFASANSCLDPILYFLSGQETRNEIKKTITKSTKTVNVDSRSTTEF